MVKLKVDVRIKKSQGSVKVRVMIMVKLKVMLRVKLNFILKVKVKFNVDKNAKVT